MTPAEKTLRAALATALDTMWQVAIDQKTPPAVANTLLVQIEALLPKLEPQAPEAHA